MRSGWPNKVRSFRYTPKPVYIRLTFWTLGGSSDILIKCSMTSTGGAAAVPWILNGQVYRRPDRASAKPSRLKEQNARMGGLSPARGLLALWGAVGLLYIMQVFHRLDFVVRSSIKEDFSHCLFFFLLEIKVRNLCEAFSVTDGERLWRSPGLRVSPYRTRWRTGELRP